LKYNFLKVKQLDVKFKYPQSPPTTSNHQQTKNSTQYPPTHITYHRNNFDILIIMDAGRKHRGAGSNNCQGCIDHRPILLSLGPKQVHEVYSGTVFSMRNSRSSFLLRYSVEHFFWFTLGVDFTF